MDAQALREDFPALRRTVGGRPLVYLDNAATTQRPRQVLETITRVYTEFNANPHRSPHRLGQTATDLYTQAHESVARFIGARGAQEIVFVRNTTEAINLVAVCLTRAQSGELRLKPGQEILITIAEHHSNLVPWQRLCAETGLTLRVAGLRDDGSLDLGHLASLLGSRTRLVCCTHVSNVLGGINPVGEIARLAHQAGALLLVDGAQAVPSLPIRVEELGCDFLAFSGHKMLAPFGSGVLYAREEILERLSPFLYGGGMIESVSLEDSTWNSLPWRFEAGTPDLASGIALGGATDRGTGVRLAGALDYLSAIGMEAVRDHERGLVQRLLDGLASIPGARILGPQGASQRAAPVSFHIEGTDPLLLAQLLDVEGIAVRAGGHCAFPLASLFSAQGTVRVSPYIYNTTAEVDHFLNTLADIVKNQLG